MALIETYRPGSEGEDTFVDIDAPALNFGTAGLLEVGRIGAAEQRAFVKFAVPLKPGWDVINAILRITVADFIPGIDVEVPTVAAHRIGQSWKELTTTWNNQPGVSGSALSSVNVSGAGVFTFGVASAVDAWQAGQNNNGFRFAYPGSGDGNRFRFYSFDATDPDTRPSLQITWAAKAPNAPIVLADGFPANESTVLAWTFSHDDPTAQQTAYQVEILQADDATPMFLVPKTTGSTQQVTVPAGTLDNDVEYQWRVRTWGPEDTVGPFSGYDLFTTSARPVATITAPASGETVETSSYDVTWDYTGTLPQAQYRLRLYEAAGNTLVHDSGIVNSILTSETVSDLRDVTSYTVEVEVWSSAGIFNSPIASRNFVVDTVPPATPTVEFIGDTENGVVRIAITNPAPSVVEVATDHNEVWRQGGSDTDWVRIAADVAPNSEYWDPTVAGGIYYGYRVVAHSVVQTTAQVEGNALMDLYGVWLHEAGKPDTVIHLLYDGALGRSEQWTPEVELLRFAGRTGAVAEFGPQVTAEFVDVRVQLASGTEDRAVLKDYARRRTVLCYRDGQQRKVYGVISTLAIQDQAYGGSADFRVDIVDYTETGV